MQRIELPLVVAPKRRSKPPGYKPVLPRSKQLAFCRDVLTAADDSWTKAADVIRRWAAEMPKLTPKLNSLGRMGRWTGWRGRMLHMAKNLRKGRPWTDIVSLEGNDKLGQFAVWSTLPIFTCPGMGECGKWCYSLKGWRCPGAMLRQLQNTLVQRHRPDLLTASFLSIPAGMTFRLFVDGDFDSLDTVRFWMGLLRSRPDVQAYGYSKSWDLLWEYHVETGGDWPLNYMLNLSSGGRKQRATAAMMRSLPIYRGEFIALHIDYRPAGVKGNIGHKRYKDRAYHAAVLKAARAAGIKKAFSCPGKCDACTSHGHACGTARYKGIPVVIGIH